MLEADIEYTLESIGQTYGITRERVRQIENYGITSIQKSVTYKEFEPVFEELQAIISSLGGGLIAEHVLLDEITSDLTDSVKKLFSSKIC